MRHSFIPIIALTTAASAQTRSSAHYSITADSVNSAGTTATSAHFTASGHAGTVAATSSSAGEVSKSGFLGQIYDVTGLTLTAAQNTVAENGTRQLTPLLTLDDATLIAVPPALGTWSVLDGPVDITTGGLAYGEIIAAADTALVRVAYLGFTADLSLSVLNVNTDDFGTYAADGLADDWQVQYFGENSPQAAPGLDPDGDGFTNLFEFTAGLAPDSAASVFRHRIESVPGQPLQKRIVFQPRLAGRTYVIESSPSLGSTANWQPLASTTISDDGDQRAITDLDASGGMRFYRVRIEMP
jgi:hypothetical protein